MKASIHSQYLDTLGGGERYILGVVKTLLNRGYKVDLEWGSVDIIKKLEDRFGVKLSGVDVVSDINRGDGYDLCFWVSDGSIPVLRARKNLLHFQVPFRHVGGNNLLNKMKLFRVDHVICNSQFTKNIIDQEYGVESIVIYPPVDVVKIKPKRKENLIIYVGRFSQLVQAKGHEVLIRAFKSFSNKSELKDWRLVFAGGSEVGVGDYLEKLKRLANSLPIEFIENIKYSELCVLYGKAKFFWSAAGFGVNENKNPEKLEHFGISTVEAMAGGAVPIVFSGGGQPEIIKSGFNGFLWNKSGEMISQTKKLIKDRHLYKVVSSEAQVIANKFSDQEFEKKFISLL